MALAVGSLAVPVGTCALLRCEEIVVPGMAGDNVWGLVSLGAVPVYVRASELWLLEAVPTGVLPAQWGQVDIVEVADNGLLHGLSAGPSVLVGRGILVDALDVGAPARPRAWVQLAGPAGVAVCVAWESLTLVRPAGTAAAPPFVP